MNALLVIFLIICVGGALQLIGMAMGADDDWS